MIDARYLSREVLASIRRHQRQLLAFHLYFTLLTLTTLTPLSGWLLAAMLNISGQSMVGNTDLLYFMTTPAGLVWLLLSGTLAAVFVFIHHAGMILVTSRDAQHQPCSAIAALWRVAHRLPQLLQLAGLQVVAHLLLAAPLLGLLAFAFHYFLGGYDIYYVINEHPPELWQFGAVAALVGALILALNGSLYLRWVFALPALLLDQHKPVSALKRSAETGRGARLDIGFKLLLIALAVALLPLMVSLLFDLMGTAVLSVLPERYGVLIPVMVLLIATYGLVSLLLAFLGVSANSLAILKLYHRYANQACVLPPDPEPRGTGFWAWGAEVLLVVLALGQLVYVAQTFDARDQVAISAHRGSSMIAPENTLAAIEQAIEDGADYVELDVRATADGVLVLLHDRDLLRIAGDPRNIWEVPYEEVRQMDAGAWFHPDFRGERVPTLSEAIELLRGRAKLYLEIKTSPHSPSLVRDTVEALQREQFVSQTLLTALTPGVLHEARSLEPELETSLLVHTAIGAVEGQPFEALAFRDALVTPSRLNLVRRHGHELHVWTVNDRREMGRFIDMGVDNIITDRPDVLAELLRERAELSDAERLLIRVRNWVW